MLDTFIFADTDAGRAARAHLVNTFTAAGRTCREFEEDHVSGGHTTHLLLLEVGKRKDEGKIAADMKQRKQ